MEHGVFDAAMEPGRLWVAAGEIAAHDRLKGFVLQQGAAQINSDPMCQRTRP